MVEQQNPDLDVLDQTCSISCSPSGARSSCLRPTASSRSPTSSCRSATRADVDAKMEAACCRSSISRRRVGARDRHRQRLPHALLASRKAFVTSVEINPRLAAEARGRLARAASAGRTRGRDGAQRYGSEHYDAIRAHRVDADRARGPRRAAQARRPAVRRRRRRAGDDGAPAALGRAGYGVRDRPVRNGDPALKNAAQPPASCSDSAPPHGRTAMPVRTLPDLRR